MAEEERSYADVQANTIYGFFTNLRQKPTDNVYRLEFIENLVPTASYNIRVGRLLHVMIFVTMIAFALVGYTFSNLVRMKYIFIPVALTLVGIFILSIQYLFVEPATGSMLGKATRFAKFIYNKEKIKRGHGVAPRRTHLSGVDETGLIEFSNGDVGRALLIDGSTSITAYPEEIRALETLNQTYQQSRDRDVTEIKITSSQRQTTVMQQESMRELADNAENQAVRMLIEQQQGFLKNYVDGQRSTIVQHIIVRAPNIEQLDSYIDRMYAFQRRGLFYRISELTHRETDDLLDILRFK